MHKVTVNGNEFKVADGTVLSEVLSHGSVNFEHPCGGLGKCRKCTVLVDGKYELSCRYVIKKDTEVIIPDKDEIESYAGDMEFSVTSEISDFVLDIGTTTLALAAISEKGKVVGVKTCTNPQRTFGADIMSRIDYCSKNGIEELQSCLIKPVNDMIKSFGESAGQVMYVAGNVTMLHTFFGVDCSSIGKAPYTPSFLESLSRDAEELGICGVKKIISLPSVSSFVGADIVAGLNYAQTPADGKYSFLIDLGTNAEIALFDSESVLCTAAAAGPCFEGANISCGMSATPGAVYEFSSDGAKVISDAEPLGICGTGLIDVVAHLVKNEIIDETGFMEDEEFEFAPGVKLIQDDVRQYQLAKSAVFSAVMTLMDIKGIGFADIENVYISGGFSSKINIGNAVISGLLPSEFSGKCVALNNSSLIGTVKYAYEKNDLSKIINNAEYVDLSANSVFTDLFVENMMFE